MLRVPVKSSVVASLLKKRIMEGLYLPQQKIPACRVLQKETGASHLTVFSALRQLQRDGFIESQGNRGNYVHSSPPHLCRYGFLWAGYPIEKWSLFHQALNAAICAYNQSGQPAKIQCYGKPGEVQPSDHEALFTDIRSNRLAGIIMASTSFDFSQTPIHSPKPFPSVSIWDGHAGSYIKMDYQSFWKEAVNFLERKRCKRVAVLCPSLMNAREVSEIVNRMMVNTGMKLDQRLLQAISYHNPGWVENSLALMMSLPRSQRPDGLIIADDNLVTEVTSSLKKIGVKNTPLVGLANFPSLPPTHLPVQFIGFDANEIIGACIKAIESQRKGARLIPLQEISARIVGLINQKQ